MQKKYLKKCNYKKLQKVSHKISKKCKKVITRSATDTIIGFLSREYLQSILFRPQITGFDIFYISGGPFSLKSLLVDHLVTENLYRSNSLYRNFKISLCFVSRYKNVDEQSSNSIKYILFRSIFQNLKVDIENAQRLLASYLKSRSIQRG